MRIVSLSFMLAATICIMGAGEPLATLESAGTVQQESADIAVDATPLTLPEAAKAWIDYAGTGNIDILNNGLVVVHIPPVLVADERGKVTFEKEGEVAVFQTESARDVEGDLFAVLSLEGVNFEIMWGSERDGIDGVISVRSGTDKQVGFRVEFAEASADILYGASCSADCKNGKCSITCTATGKAAQCYCTATGDPVCECIDRPAPSDP